MTSLADDQEETTKDFICIIVFLIRSKNADVKSGSSSPVTTPSITQAAQQLAKKAFWFSDGLVNPQAYPVPTGDAVASVEQTLLSSDMVIALGLSVQGDHY